MAIFDTIIMVIEMKNILLILDSSVEEELSVVFTLMFIILITVICLTIIKYIKSK